MRSLKEKPFVPDQNLIERFLTKDDDFRKNNSVEHNIHKNPSVVTTDKKSYKSLISSNKIMSTAKKFSPARRKFSRNNYNEDDSNNTNSGKSKEGLNLAKGDHNPNIIYNINRHDILYNHQFDELDFLASGGNLCFVSPFLPINIKVLVNHDENTGEAKKTILLSNNFSQESSSNYYYIKKVLFEKCKSMRFIWIGGMELSTIEDKSAENLEFIQNHLLKTKNMYPIF